MNHYLSWLNIPYEGTFCLETKGQQKLRTCLCVLTGSVSDINWVASNLLRCSLFWLVLCRCCSSPLLWLFSWLCSPILIPQHIRFHSSCFHTLLTAGSVIANPNTTPPKGRQHRKPLSISVPERSPQTLYSSGNAVSVLPLLELGSS